MRLPKLSLLFLLLLCSFLCYSQEKLAPEVLIDSNYKAGRDFATSTYKNYDFPSFATFVVSLVNPVLGLAPAFGTTKTRLYVPMYPVNERLNDAAFLAGYTDAAKRIRSRKVWKYYTIGSAVNVTITVGMILLVSSITDARPRF